MPFKPVGVDENGSFPPRVEAKILDNLEKNPKIAGAKTQSILLGEALRKLRKGDPFKMVVRGDSTTYGHDTVSADKVAAPTTTLPDGSKHSFTRSPKPYPDALQDCLQTAYGRTNITVENQGYSGDHVDRGYRRWLNNVDADITVISYGINDASASYVPDDKRGNVTAFVEDTEKMILRDLAWGSAVVLLTPTRQLGQSGNVDTDTFRNAWYSLASKYGIPVIDGEMFLDTQQRDAWSDGNHLTTKGNYVMGARLAAVFLAENPLAPVKVTGGSKLLARPTMHGFVKGSADGYSQSSGYPTPEDNAAGNGSAVSLAKGSNGSLWTFYVDQPDLVVMPSSYISPSTANGETGASIEYILDFDASQGDDYIDRSVGDATNDYVNTTNSVVHGPYTNINSYADLGGISTHNVYIRIATPGWHTLRAVPTKSADATLLAVHGLEFADQRVWRAARDDSALSGRIATLEAVKTRGVYVQNVPASFNETAAINSTNVPMMAIYEALFGNHFVSDYYKAQPFKLTVTSYGGAIIEYLIMHTLRDGTVDQAAKTVDSAATNTGAGLILLVKKLNETSLLSGGGSAGTNTSARELASVAFTAATKELIFNWKTLNSDGTTAKNMTKNFTMAFSPL
ncbi:hydrolase [Arthrobacter phage Truckee]|nr:hydrolase [Arthrobacter phage Truckee]